MWRQATKVLSLPPQTSRVGAGRWTERLATHVTKIAAIPGSNNVLGNYETTTVRYLARRPQPPGLLDDPEEELLATGTRPSSLDSSSSSSSSTRKRTKKVPSATDMEFFSVGGAGEDDLDDDDYDDFDDDPEARRNAEYQRKQEEIRKELDAKTGRGWTDPWQITEEQWTSLHTAEDLPAWSPEFVSRISQERVKIHPDGIPTLAVLATLPLPPEACPHPGLGQTKEYAAYRKKYHYNYIAKKVEELAQPKLDKILKLTDWEHKQNAVDELFETIDEELRNQEEILGLHPEFGKWVEGALEKYLTKVKYGDVPNKHATRSNEEILDATAEPVFMDCYNPAEADSVVPSILSPLAPHPKEGPGRMVEEWQLAAHKSTKRIMIRSCTRKIAETLQNNDASRILVSGRRGVGKTAVLASIVASARKSGNIVMYLPDGDRLRKNGFFVIPNTHRSGMYDLQDLSQEVCAQFFESHGSDLQGMVADKATMGKYFKEAQLNKIDNYSGDSMGLVELLKHAAERKSDAPMCFSAVVEALMNQTDRPFLMVLDEFNCYFDRGHYFHMSYDENVRTPIPYNKINLFEHALAAMAVSSNPEDENLDATPKLMKRGGIIAGLTDSRAVKRSVTEGLATYAKAKSFSDASLTVVEVPHFSEIEVHHILANFEAIGLGTLRFDRGDTLMNANEVAYLKMISGSIGQRLVDASVL